MKSANSLARRVTSTAIGGLRIAGRTALMPVRLIMAVASIAAAAARLLAARIMSAITADEI